MKIINLNGTTIELYDDFKELTVKRHRAFQKYILIDIGVGTDFQDIIKHFEKLHFFLSSDKNDFAKKEAENLHYAMHEMVNEVDYKCYSFACLIHKYDGKPVENYSEEYLDTVLNDLDALGLTQAMVEEYLDQIKKKLITI
jgi:hypothetical protein